MATVEVPLRPLTEVYPTGCWSGHPCFVLGGGPSLGGVDLSLVPASAKVLGTNQSWRLGRCDLCFVYDTRVYERAAREHRSHAREVDWVFVRAVKTHDARLWQAEKHRHFVIGRSGSVSWGDPLEQGCMSFSNSGAMAVWLASQLGASPLYLLGFDMRADENGSIPHFHSDYPENWTSNGRVLKSFAEDFQKRIAPAAKAGGTEILNCSMESALECFEKVPFEEAVRRCGGSGKAGVIDAAAL